MFYPEMFNTRNNLMQKKEKTFLYRFFIEV